MFETSPLGRPKKNRVSQAGEKLRLAFMLLRKTWGSNQDVANHVFNMKRWDLCGLPRSIKTVKDDIRLGVAYDRISGYASLLNIPPALLTDESVKHDHPDFISAVLKGRSDTSTPAIMMQNIFEEAVNEKFFDYNRPEYISELFDLLKGFYVMYLIKVPFELGINKMVFAIHDSDAYYLRTKASFYLETELGDMIGEMHCWGSFLFANFFMNSLRSFGMAMLPEPLRNPVIARRRPFHMSGKFLFGAEAFGPDPLFAIFHMERRQDLPERNWEEKFDDFRLANISYQFVFAGDPEYDYALARLRHARGGDCEDGGWGAG